MRQPILEEDAVEARCGVIGLVLGLPLSLAARRLLDSQTTRVDTVDNPSVILVGGIVAAAVLVVASAATLIPATRAARVNPVTALSRPKQNSVAAELQL